MRVLFGNAWHSELTRQRVDRHATRQPHRLLAGLAVSADFTAIEAALIVAQGRGRFLHIKHCEQARLDLPQPLHSVLLSQASGNAGASADLKALATDLTDQLALATEMLKSLAGKFVDRILAVSILFQSSEADCEVNGVEQLCLPERLAELTGMNVIDSFPHRDRAAGGQGFPLAALPYWLLFADRKDNVARGDVALTVLDRHCDLFWLPESDGLMTTVPAIHWHRCPVRPGLVPADQSAETPAQIARQILTFLNRCAETQRRPVRQLVVAGPHPLTSHLLPLFGQQSANMDIPETVSVAADLGIPDGALNPSVAAILGALFIDQTPANVPELTNASGLRCLGRITPGAAPRWRALLTSMSDYQPTALPLRDAL